MSISKIKEQKKTKGELTFKELKRMTEKMNKEFPSRDNYYVTPKQCEHEWRQLLNNMMFKNYDVTCYDADVNKGFYCIKCLEIKYL